MDISYPSNPLCNNRRTLACAIALTVAFAGQAQAAPNGGTIVGGDGSISQTGSETTIIQESDRLAIDWDNFNIGADERVQFVQPDSSSLALNRILGNDASQIFGRLDANGHVVLVNPNGVVFGESATVNVGGLVASGLNISSEDFMNGDFAFHASGTGGGVVINSGLIHAASGGNVALLGNQVVNEGLISAELGTVTLAAGREAVLTFDPQGLLGVRVTKETLQNKLGVEPAVLNSGEIRASSGRVLLTASASQDVFSQAVNSGDLAGDTGVLMHADGSFSLGKGANLVNTGEIDVGNNGRNETDSGGNVVLLGKDIKHSGTILSDAGQSDAAGDVVLAASGRTWLQDGSLISTNAEFTPTSSSGAITLLGKQVGLTGDATVQSEGSGGQVIIGAKGSSAAGSRLRDTELVLVGEDATVSATNLIKGNISAWAKRAMVIEGELDASSRWGKGSVQLVSEGSLGLTGNVNFINAEIGANIGNGDLLLQGKKLSVTGRDSFFSISDDALTNALQGGSVTLRSDRGLGISEANISAQDSPITHSLTLLSGGTVLMYDSTIELQRGNLTVVAGAEGLRPYKNRPSRIELQDTTITSIGSLIMDAAADIYAGSSVINVPRVMATAGGDVELPLGGEVSVATITALGDVQISTEETAYRPDLQVQGRDVQIDSSSGFEGRIEAQNLLLSGNEFGLGTVAELQVSGVTRIQSGDTFQLAGDLNVLTIDGGYSGVVDVVEENDLVLGDMDLNSRTLSVTSLGSGATVSQATNSTINLAYGMLDLAADNVSLGADGTGTVSLDGGMLRVSFRDMLKLHAAVAAAGNVVAQIGITGSEGANTVEIGEFFGNLNQEFGFASIDLGGGSDTISLAADTPVPLALGAGADVINLLAADVDYNAVDFDPSEDTVNAYTP